MKHPDAVLQEIWQIKDTAFDAVGRDSQRFVAQLRARSAQLREIPGKVDMVDVFRKTADVLPVVEDAIAIGARVFWQQLGVRNEEAAARARAAGLEIVMDRCVKIEHGRLFVGLNWVGVNTRVISAKRPRWPAY